MIRIERGNPERLKEIRLELGMTQAQLAEALGVRGNTAARWERGEPMPPLMAEMAAEHLLSQQQGKGK